MLAASVLAAGGISLTQHGISSYSPVEPQRLQEAIQRETVIACNRPISSTRVGRKPIGWRTTLRADLRWRGRCTAREELHHRTSKRFTPPRTFAQKLRRCSRLPCDKSAPERANRSRSERTAPVATRLGHGELMPTLNADRRCAERFQVGLPVSMDRQVCSLSELSPRGLLLQATLPPALGKTVHLQLRYEAENGGSEIDSVRGGDSASGGARGRLPRRRSAERSSVLEGEELVADQSSALPSWVM